jgi:AhpC/TSA family
MIIMNFFAVKYDNQLNSIMNLEFLTKSWMKYSLLAAAGTHFIFGVFAILFPVPLLNILGVDIAGVAVTFWQCLGCFFAWMGLGYWFASRRAHSQSHFLMLAMVQQLTFLLIIAYFVMTNALPASFLWIGTILGGAWTLPCAGILWREVRWSHVRGTAYDEPEADDPLFELRTNTGKRLDELADESPQLVVFLRHAGCTFCRQALADIQTFRQQIEVTGCGIIFVHLGNETDAEAVEVFKRYEVDDLPRISDPTSRLYRQFGLDLGGFSQLFGLKVWLNGFLFGVVNGHGIGSVRGNSFQMPGVYLYHCGTILGGFRHETAADRPDYVELARQASFKKEAQAPEVVATMPLT